MDSSVFLELATAEHSFFSGPRCFFRRAVSVGRMNMVVDYPDYIAKRGRHVW